MPETGCSDSCPVRSVAAQLVMPLTLLSIVVCLVANAGYFMWARGIARPVEMPAPMKPAATLKLASGLGGGAGSERAPIRLRCRQRQCHSGNASADYARLARASGPPLQGCSPMWTLHQHRAVRDMSVCGRDHTAWGWLIRDNASPTARSGQVWVYLPLPHELRNQILAKLKAGGIDVLLEYWPNDDSVIARIV